MSIKIFSSIFKSPFVTRSTHNEALQALEESNKEVQRAIFALFSTAQKHRRELLLAEKKRLTDLAHALELKQGSECEIGGVSFRYRD